jgi:aryl-alcohol dehydrogenase-like predicted oxidoreductase
MEKRILGRTGLKVSVLGLGGFFVSSVGSARMEGVETVRRAVELGVNYIDTARSYADSEEVIGEGLKGIPPERRPHVATKIGGWPVPFDAQDIATLRTSFPESLSKLGLDSVAGIQVHEPDRPALFDWWEDDALAKGPVMDVVAELKQSGLVKFIGLGGTTAYELGRLVQTGRFDTVITAFNYSLLWREAEEPVIAEAKKLGVGVIVGTPFQQGALARRYDAELSTAKWLSPPRRKQYQLLYSLLDDLHMPIHELALRWVISNPNVATVVVGARSVKEIEMNVEAAEKGPLEARTLADLDRIAALVPFRPFEEPGGAFGLPFGRRYKGPGPLQGTRVVGGITSRDRK